jgi:hypothetical protein
MPFDGTRRADAEMSGLRAAPLHCGGPTQPAATKRPEPSTARAEAPSTVESETTFVRVTVPWRAPDESNRARKTRSPEKPVTMAARVARQEVLRNWSATIESLTTS